MIMEARTTSTTLTARLPILNPGDYDLWLMRIEQYFLMTDYSLWEVIKNGNKVLKRTVGETEQEYEPTTTEEKQDRRNEIKARGTLLMSLLNKDQLKFHSYKDAKLLMEAIEKRYGRNKESKKLEIQGEVITQEDINLKLLRSLPSEWKTHALIKTNKEEIKTIILDDLYNNLNIYKPELAGSSSTSQNSQNVAFVSSNSTNSNYNSSTNEADNTAYGVSAAHTQCNSTSGDNLSDAMICAFLASQPNSPQLAREDLEQIDPDDLEEIDLQWEMAMLTIKCRASRNQKNRGRENNRRTVTAETPTENALVAQDGIGGYDWSYQDKEEHPTNFALMAHTSSGSSSSSDSELLTILKTELGYNAASSTAASPVVESFVNSSKMFKNQEYNKSKSDKGYHAVSPPYTGNFIPFKPDLTFMDEINSVRPPVIEDWNSVDESEVGIIPKDKTVSSSIEKIKFVKSARETIEKGNPQQKEYKEKAVIDSGCSRHMTGNKCYLDEYEDYDGGFVSFGDGKGRISGKGKIKTGSLDFDDVYFCKELKYNLFSVSQICDKKNNVLFTDTECLVLSSDFKLLDKSQVLLRVPRKDNIYSVDLKSVVPTGGLTCLIAKAIIDGSNTWHRRLGHINFKTMNKLVKGNLVKGLPSKIFENDHSCVACQKGKQHKASYKTKLVNSISKPLHMLHMDLFGPTNIKSLMKKSYCLVVTDDFSRFSWVFFLATKNETSENLNTFITEIENLLDHKVKVIRCDNGTEFKNSIMNRFCEMKGVKREFSIARTPQQNGVAERKNRTLIEAARTMVLVIKPHNKTPYELIHGRPPLIDFMKPFGCPITILNTRENLGKFDGKADEGYFVGYSVVSKAIRVFNNRTMIVKETLNIRFLENKPNVKGNGPDWLFDVDSLTISMNYVPVVAGNQTDGIAGTKDNIVTGHAQKEKEPEQEYILITLCTTDPLISQGPKDSEGDTGMKLYD
ncbi:putative ribonuclease H-like domain-containing protein [Tanacetum coccineum]